jgi:hypothetical protein
VPPGIQLRGSNFIAELVADDNDVQKSSAISIKNFNEIIDDGTSKSPSSNDEEVTVSSISIINTLFIILQHVISFVHEPYYFLLFLGRTGDGGV